MFSRLMENWLFCLISQSINDSHPSTEFVLFVHRIGEELAIHNADLWVSRKIYFTFFCNFRYKFAGENNVKYIRGGTYKVLSE